MQRLLKPHGSRIEVIGEADSGPAALTQINALQPDLVFLDIQMPGLTGFELIAELTQPPHIIFVTAFDTFALKAFEVNAIDYLVKPVRPKRLENAINRLPQAPEPNDAINRLLSYIQQPKPASLDRIAIKKGNRILFLESDNIAYFKSEDKYTFAVGSHGEEIVTQTLTELEKSLDPQQFVRIHRGYLINRDHLLELRRLNTGSYHAIVSAPKPHALPVSRNGLKHLMNEDN